MLFLFCKHQHLIELKYAKKGDGEAGVR